MIYEKYEVKLPGPPKEKDAKISITLGPEAAKQLAAFCACVGGDPTTTLRGFFSLMGRQLEAQGYHFIKNPPEYSREKLFKNLLSSGSILFLTREVSK